MSTLKTINVQHPSSSNANLALDNSGNVAMQAGTASAPAIYPTGDSNTGIYSPGANRLGFTTDGTQRGEFDASGNFQFNSGYGSVATAYGCRAWVNFNGSGTVAIRADGGISSITDNNVGDYTVNFDVAMPDANYSVAGTAEGAGMTLSSDATTYTSSAARVLIYRNITAFDRTIISVQIFR